MPPSDASALLAAAAPARVRGVRHDPRRAAAGLVRRHRRAVAAGLAALAVMLGLGSLSPAAPPTVDVVVAARDLAAGHVVVAGDLVTTAVPAPLSVAAMGDPAAALGRVLVAPLAAGAVVPVGAVAGPEALASQLRAAGRSDVAVPVRLADAGAAALLQPGDVVDIWATRASSLADATGTATDDGGLSRRVAASVTVLAVPRPDRGGLLSGGDAASATGGLVVLAVPASTVAGLAHAAAAARLAATVLPR